MRLQGPNGSRREADDAARTLRGIAIAAALVLIVWVLSDLLLLIFLAVLIAVMLRGAADWAARHTGAPEQAMLAVVTVGAAASLVGFLYYLGPRLVSQSQALWAQLHEQVDNLRQVYGATPWGHAIFSRLSQSEAMQSHIATYAGSVATSTLGGLATSFVVIATALYFAISPDLYIDGFVRLFPLPYRTRVREVLLDIGQTLQWWSLGQLIDMAVVGILTGIGLFFLGVPLALALAVLAGLFTFVPYFGAIIAAVPAMLVALAIGWQESLWVLAIFLGCHTVEGYLVSPLVQRRTIHLPPAASILSMTILGTMFGPLGVILGTPIAAALMVAVREAYVGDVLGDAGATTTRAPDTGDARLRLAQAGRGIGRLKAE
jgi:predicted PurR-regulated permease PerM